MPDSSDSPIRPLTEYERQDAEKRADATRMFERRRQVFLADMEKDEEARRARELVTQEQAIRPTPTNPRRPADHPAG